MKETSLKPNKHFMSFLTFLLLLPLVYFIPSFITLYISEDRFLVSLISVAIIVPLLSYCLMPMLLKMLARFSLI